MRIEVEIEAQGGMVRVMLRGTGDQRIWGKFVFGRLKGEPDKRALVFDDEAVFHKDIAAAYGVEVSGGGWIEFDQTNRTALVGGKSTQFGREPDRGLTVDLLDEALPGYRVEAV
jgi:hypothetical protein